MRAIPTDGSVTIERRWIRPGEPPTEWRPITIGALRALMKGNVIPSWLERNGVLFGAWLGRGADEIAAFGR